MRKFFYHIYQPFIPFFFTFCKQEICQQIKLFDKELVKLGNAQDKLLREVPEKPYKRKMVEQRRVPQVRAIYSYNGHGIDVVKGELMFLLAKSNKDWWNVRTASGNDGFVPANYVKVLPT